MDEAKVFGTMWSAGFGNMNDALFGKDRDSHPKKRAIKADWETHRMPRTRTHVTLGMDITADEFEILAWGHIPEEMEDHWFMYFDGEAFNFYRSWTGFCIYRMKVERRGDHYHLSHATVNRSKKQYGETDDEKDRIMCAVLLGQALGKDVEELWQAFFDRCDGD